MDFETVYLLINLSVVPAWGLLIFAPRWSITDKVVHAVFFPLMLIAAYVYFIGWGIFFGAAAEGAGMSSLKEVMALFDSPVSTLGAWVHYLVFDLFVGAWIARDARRRGIAHLLTVPCLLLAFMFGPVGLGLYLLLRMALGKGRTSLIEV